MGLLDSLGGMLKGAMGEAEAAALPAVLNAVLAKTQYRDLNGLVAALQQEFAGHTLGAGGLFEVIAELAFLGEVDALGLLLLAKLQAVADNFGFAIFTVLARRKVALFDRTFVSETFCAFEEKLHPLAAA